MQIDKEKATLQLFILNAPEEPFLQRSRITRRQKGFEDYGRVVCYAM